MTTIADSLALVCSSGLRFWLVHTPLICSILTWGAPATTLPCPHRSRHTHTHATTAASAKTSAHASADAPSLRSTQSPPPTRWPWHLCGSSRPVNHHQAADSVAFYQAVGPELTYTATTTTTSTIPCNLRSCIPHSCLLFDQISSWIKSWRELCSHVHISIIISISLTQVLTAGSCLPLTHQTPCVSQT
jgi:hypothetical protein